MNDKLVGHPVKLNKQVTDENKKLLVPIGDLHYGAINSDVDKFQATLEFCRQANAWILLMGDLMEASTRYSIGAGVYEQAITPQQQLDDVVAMLEPYKDLIIGSHMGNHEFRIYKETGINIMKVMCKLLKMRYLGYAVNHVLHVGNQRYVVFSTHGSSGATLRHTKIKKVLDVSAWNKSDLYLYAHVHTLDMKSDEYREYDSRNKTMVSKKRYFVLTGSFLRYDDSYAEMKNYQPERVGVANIHLDGTKFDIHVSI
jgi:hypothetical protein